MGHITHRGPSLLRAMLVGGVDDLSAQPLGAGVREQDQPRLKGQAKAGDRGAGEEGADHSVGHAQEQPAVPLAVDGGVNELKAVDLKYKPDMPL